MFAQPDHSLSQALAGLSLEPSAPHQLHTNANHADHLVPGAPAAAEHPSALSPPPGAAGLQQGQALLRLLQGSSLPHQQQQQQLNQQQVQQRPPPGFGGPMPPPPQQFAAPLPPPLGMPMVNAGSQQQQQLGGSGLNSLFDGGIWSTGPTTGPAASLALPPGHPAPSSGGGMWDQVGVWSVAQLASGAPQPPPLPPLPPHMPPLVPGPLQPPPQPGQQAPQQQPGSARPPLQRYDPLAALLHRAHQQQQFQQQQPGQHQGQLPPAPDGPPPSLLALQQQQELAPAPAMQPVTDVPGGLYGLAPPQLSQQMQHQPGLLTPDGLAPIRASGQPMPGLGPRGQHPAPSPRAGAATSPSPRAGGAASPPGQAPKVVRGPPARGVPAAAAGRGPKVQEGRENRWVDHMDRRHHGQAPRAFGDGNLGALDGALRALADSLMPTPEERAAQVAAFEAVRGLLLARWPGARVHLFGSVANGLSVRHNNDIDVCLEVALPQGEEEAQATKSELAVELGLLCEGAGMAEVLALPKARVPVVKFVVPATKTKVDVTFNNMLACINTKLLADYVAIDPRLAQLVALIKHWAKQRAVNDAYRGTLSSYCYVLMAIYHLQSRRPPVLPVLQALPPTFSARVGPWLCEFCDDAEGLRGFGAANTETLAELLWSFFEYWAWRHDWAHGVVSVRSGGLLGKEAKGWTRRVGSERHLVCVEDPFETSHDLGRTVDRQTRQVLHKEFIRAATLLRDEEDPLDSLFQPYRAGR